MASLRHRVEHRGDERNFCKKTLRSTMPHRVHWRLKPILRSLFKARQQMPLLRCKPCSPRVLSMISLSSSALNLLFHFIAFFLWVSFKIRIYIHNAHSLLWIFKCFTVVENTRFLRHFERLDKCSALFCIIMYWCYASRVSGLSSS